MNQSLRATFLTNIEKMWIEGVLNQSLHRQLQDSTALSRPFDTILQAPDAASIRIDSIHQILQKYQSGLVIAGEAGSGTTTILLELLRDLIEDAWRDETIKLPVLLNLTTWSAQYENLRAWLITELLVRYGVSNKLAAQWIDGNEVTLLLDGLDEVSEEQSSACIEAIRSIHDVSTVICCHDDDVETLQTALELEAVVRLQPMNVEQISAYLARFGEQGVTVGRWLEERPKIMSLARLPLMLNMMLAVSVHKAEIPTDSDLNSWRQHLLETYVDTTFSRADMVRPFDDRFVVNQLSWIAKELNTHQRTSFYIEALQPTWLDDSRTFVRNQRLVIWLMIAMVGIGTVFLPSYLLGLTGAEGAKEFGVMIGMFGGMLFFIGLVMINMKVPEKIAIVPRLRWDVEKSLLYIRSRPFKSILGGILWGGFAGLLFGQLGDNSDLILLYGILFGLMIGFSLAAQHGLTAIQMDNVVHPNHFIRVSLRNWPLTGIIFAFAWGSFVGFMLALPLIAVGLEEVDVVVGLIIGLIMGLVIGPLMAVPFGIAAGLNYGGRAFIGHYVLRWMLWRQVNLPIRQLPELLDYAADLGLTQRVGNGWRFMHTSFQDYFASIISD